MIFIHLQVLALSTGLFRSMSYSVGTRLTIIPVPREEVEVIDCGC